MKIKSLYLIIIFLISISCQEKEKPFYEIKPIDKMKSQLIWGNSEFKNSQIFDNFILDKEKIHVEYKNNDFIILKRGTGSDAWINLILPIKKNAKVLEKDQILAFDSVKNIAIRQNYNSEKFPFQLINLKTLEIDSIRFDTKNCESTNIIYCIDKIYFTENTLYINWTIPTKIDKKGKTEVNVYSLNQFFRK